MSKYVKQLIADQLSGELGGVDDALLVNVIGLDANASVALRSELRNKGISLRVIKNSLAKRAFEGGPLENAFNDLGGTNALCWGCEDFVSLAKEVVSVAKNPDFKGFEPTGGVMDGDQLTPDQVRDISKWPNRTEQLSILSGQILSVGANLSAALLGPGGALASQVESKSKEGE